MSPPRLRSQGRALEEHARALDVGGDHGDLGVLLQGADPALAREFHGEGRDVGPDRSLAGEFGCFDCGSAIAKRVEYEVAAVGGCVEGAIKEGYGFLGRVPEFSVRHHVDRRNVSPTL